MNSIQEITRNDSEAEQIALNDPIFIHKVVTAVIAPWEPLFNRYNNLSPGYNSEMLKH
ncbi:hypothetical protein [Paenibacillus andongensis]|uniref:hypothetical protein n=1 Tax=Paenibacillus andongensis TaxID=2975482 RepID=UPI0021BB71B4|nr:hypothetical protein [Paenibacillus andongensis]